jgi:hypothetical protein
MTRSAALIAAFGLLSACAGAGDARDTVDAAADADVLQTDQDLVEADEAAAADSGDDAAADTASPDAAPDLPGPTPDATAEVSPDALPAQDCDEGHVVYAGDVSAFDRCSVVRWLAVEGCDGEATTVTLPALEATTESVTLCLDAGDVVSMPALRTAVGLTIGYRGAATLEVSKLEIASDLTLEINQFLVELTLPGIVGADGTLALGGTSGAQTLSLPDLAHIGRIDTFGTATDRLSLPALVTAGRIDAGGLLFSWLDTPALTEVTGDVNIGARDFAEMNAPLLARIGGNYRHTVGPFDTHPGLPALERVGGDLRVARTPCESEDCGAFESSGPATFPYPVLTQISGELIIVDLPAATELSLPLLGHAGGVRIADNPALTSLALPSLVTVGGDLSITDNGSLPECLALALAASVTVSGATEISGNRAECACSRTAPPVATCVEP